MQLESIIGKLQHSSYVIPLVGHFLARFRRRISRFRKEHGASYFARFWDFRLSNEELEDFLLWKSLLDSARKGISLNGLTP